MRCLAKLPLAAALLLATTASPAQSPSYQLGRTPTADEIRSWDIAVGPEGRELPPGSGTAREGAKLYERRCARCHGPAEPHGLVYFDPNERPGAPLVGGQGTLQSKNPVKTVGSYWPFATTLWDYINRAMPRYEAGTLKADEVYAVTAYLLFKNGIIGEGDAMDSKSLPKVRMPNRDGFIPQNPGDTRLLRCRLGTCP